MRFSIITLFPEFFNSIFNASLIGKAISKEIIKVEVIYLRDFADEPHKITDDRPFGGGVGMVLKPEPIFRAVEYIQEKFGEGRIILLSPKGELLNQEKVKKLSAIDHIILICGRYEGVDERVAKFLAHEEISIGDYILSGGEYASLIMVDAIARLVPGVIGKEEATEEESFKDNLLEYPHYTRPREYRGYKVPEVLLSGNHAAIRRWRREQAIINTYLKRPDLLQKANLNEEDIRFLYSLKNPS